MKNFLLGFISKIESVAYSAGLETERIFNKLAKSEEDQLMELDEKYFQIASDELESNTQSQGLWIKVGTMTEGNIEKQKAFYIKQRAKQLSEEEYRKKLTKGIN